MGAVSSSGTWRGFLLAQAAALALAAAFSEAKDPPAGPAASKKPAAFRKFSAPGAAKTPGHEASPVDLRVSSAPSSIQELLAHFQFLDQNLGSLSAEFTQSVSLSETGATQSVSGAVDYLKPDRFHMRHLRPERQTVVSDGKTLWVHRQDQNQVIESLLEDWKRADPMVANLMDFGHYSRLLQKYTVSFDSAALQIVLRPKEARQDFVLRLGLSGPALFPVETELSVGRMRVRTTFRNIRFNPRLSESLFAFVPPQGAEVFRDFKPPIPGGDAKP